MPSFNIPAISVDLDHALKKAIDIKTKPLGALGGLETLAFQIGRIQQTLNPKLHHPHILVFAGDHGITAEGVSPYPQAVTAQMVHNFLNGGAAINVFCRQHGMTLSVVDAGVAGDLPAHPQLMSAKVGAGTRNFLREDAMTSAQAQEAMRRGAEMVRKTAAAGCNVIGFGEMGIGNTSSAAVIMSCLTETPVADCVGRGTGCDDDQLGHKIKILEQARRRIHVKPDDAFVVLKAFGGFEIVMMTAAMLQAAEQRMVILVDGFVATCALLAAYRMYPAVVDYAVFCHCSAEKAHHQLLQHWQGRPVLDLGMRLGEGTGAAVAYPILVSAVNFLNEMATFEQAGVVARSS